jgi:hypothetical protein
MTMAKTAEGHRILQDRSGGLAPRQRAALILIDGHRTLEEVLAATAAGGVTRADIAQLVESGLVAELAPGARPAASAAVRPAGASVTTRDRYLRAYGIATEITAGFGRRDSSLRLAVEAASSLEELQALAPQIRAALPPSKFAPLEAALQLP